MTAPSPRSAFLNAESAATPPPPAAAELVSVLWRRKRMIAVIAAACVALAALALSALPVRFIAQAEVLLEGRAPRVVEIDEVLPAPAMDSQAVQSEIRLVQSQQLLARVADKLRLDQDPEFGALSEGTSLAARLGQAAPGLAEALRDRLGWAPGGGAEEAGPDPRRRAVAALRDRLTVMQQDVSRVVAIRMESSDSDKAALIANAVADQYILDQLEAKFEATERAAVWLTERLSDVAERLEAAEASAEAQRARLATDHAGALSATRRRLAELGAALASERAALAAEGASEAARARARTRADALARSLSELEVQAEAQSREDIALRQTEREASALAALHQSVLTRLKETRALSGLERPDARLIAEAAAPLRPTAPNRDLVLAFALCGGLALGGAAAFVRESFWGVHHSVESAERDAGLPVLAALPRLRGWRPDLPGFVRKRPGSRLAEGVRDLRIALLPRTRNEECTVIAVTSAGAGEGKSSACAMLAESCARLGRRTVLVDADIRNPAQAHRYGLSGAADLLAALEGEATLDEVLWRDPASGLTVLPSEAAPARRAELLAGPEFAVLLESLRDQFEVVVIDTPPLLAVADGRLLAASADRVALLLRWGETRREDLRAAARTLEEAGVQAAGLVLSGTPGRADPRPGRRGGGRYGRFSEYFED